ncbi:MAG: RDD family protein [Microcystaceae cyanobacterium]
METDKLIYRRFPKIPIERRAYAFSIDFVTVWLLSSFAGEALQWLVFIITWLALRVILVEKNKGQSLGRWALDMKVIDARLNKIPDLITLAKREGIIGLAAMLAMLGFTINFRNGISMLLLISPLLADLATAFTDEEFNQAFHDRIAQTVIVPTRRGFSLDLRLKKIFAKLKRLKER